MPFPMSWNFWCHNHRPGFLYCATLPGRTTNNSTSHTNFTGCKLLSMISSVVSRQRDTFHQWSDPSKSASSQSEACFIPCEVPKYWLLKQRLDYNTVEEMNKVGEWKYVMRWGLENRRIFWENALRRSDLEISDDLYYNHEYIEMLSPKYVR